MRADVVAALIRAHVDNDHQRFRGMALSIAANLEAKSPRWAKQIRDLAGREQQQLIALPEYSGLMSQEMPTTQLSDLILEPGTHGVLVDLLSQYRRRDELGEHGLSPARKLLFCGPPGVGKSMSAAMLAYELGLPMIRVHLHGVISSHLGETAAKLAKVFEMVRARPSVYLFDEFDAIASARGVLGRDDGEMRRVVNSLLSLIELDRSASIIVSTTNMVDRIDPALFRRFDEVLSFTLPDGNQAVRVIESRLLWPQHPEYPLDFDQLGNAGADLSHSDLVTAIDRAHKYALLNGRKYVNTTGLVVEIERRRRAAREE